MGGEERKGETSVHEEIAGAVEKAFGCTVSKFHSAGREDIDVRMLGAGRPFVLELVGESLLYASLAVWLLRAR